MSHRTGFPLVEGTGDPPPTTRKIDLSPYVPTKPLNTDTELNSERITKALGISWLFSFLLCFFFLKKKTLWPLFMDSVKLSKNWPCWSHIDLGLIACSRNRGLQLYLKETPTQVFSCELCEIFKNTFFMEHLQTTASRNRMKNASPTGYFKVHHTMMSFLLFHLLCQEIQIFIQA